MKCIGPSYLYFNAACIQGDHIPNHLLTKINGISRKVFFHETASCDLMVRIPTHQTKDTFLRYCHNLINRFSKSLMYNTLPACLDFLIDVSDWQCSSKMWLQLVVQYLSESCNKRVSFVPLLGLKNTWFQNIIVVQKLNTMARDC